jgi:hypothetical protein
MRRIKIIAAIVLTGMLIGIQTWIEKAARPVPERQPGQAAAPAAAPDEHAGHNH